jgi:cytochrome P450
MTMSIDRDVYYDPYDVGIGTDPFPAFARLREEAPLYFNEEYGFYALSRHADVSAALVDRETYTSGHGVVLEQIKANMTFPPGTVIFEDPPAHTRHRALLSRLFTPRAIGALESKVREFCINCLDPLVGGEGFDFISDLGAQVPAQAIALLLGIPPEDQFTIRDHMMRSMEHVEPGAPQELMTTSEFYEGDVFADYIDWRTEHPSNDVMTELLQAEFEDEEGVTRRLRREEVLTYVNLLALAGNETTALFIGWMGKLLGDHPEQRRLLVEDPSSIPSAVEELLRMSPPGIQTWRYVTRDVEHYGTTVPAGSAMGMLLASANRDERRYSNPDELDVRRDEGQHLSFAFGAHFCLGAALARLEARVALEEVLKRFPLWEVDDDRAKLLVTSTFRGYETLPVRTG